MSEKRVGLIAGTTYASARGNAADILSEIERAEELGIPAVWMVTSGAGIDALTVFAAAAARTKRIMMGTFIVTCFPRHPVVMAQQVQVIDHLAPGRFRLGVGSGHKIGEERTFGVDFRAPLGHLRECLRIVKPCFTMGPWISRGAFIAPARASYRPWTCP